MKLLMTFAGLATLLLAGCAAEPYRVSRTVTTPGGLTTEEIVRMSKSGISDSVLVEKIRSDGVAARPTADQIASLKQDGLSDEVVKAMINAPVRETSVQVTDYPNLYYYPYAYPYPYPYYGYYGYYGPYWYGHGHYPYYGHPYWGHYGHYYHSYPRGAPSVSHYRH